MPSLAEVKHEYVKDEIDRLDASNAEAKATIEENTKRLQYLQGESTRAVEKLIEEHPASGEVTAKVEPKKVDGKRTDVRGDTRGRRK